MKSRKLAQYTKKVVCSIVLSVKNILTSPHFKIEKKKPKEEQKLQKIISYQGQMKQLGKATKNEEFKGKLHYLCPFPDPSLHQI